MDNETRNTIAVQTIYYAHPMSWYGTAGEKDDIAALQAEGFKVVNPNAAHFERLVNIARINDQPIMDIFRATIQHVDALAFRSFNNDVVSSGVATEIMEAWLWDKPILRLVGGCNALVCAPVSIITNAVPDWHRVANIKTTWDWIKRGIL